MRRISMIGAVTLCLRAWQTRAGTSDVKSVEAAAHGEYKSTDVNKNTGAMTTDKGKGINIFHRGTDGNRRVAIDGWSPDVPSMQ
jgi:hypothetical protein